MATTLVPNRHRASQKHPAPSGLAQLKHLLWLTCVRGPKLLLTSRISVKCAILMILMIAPSLVYCFMLTVPGLIFQSPQQQAYFYFSRVLNEDPTRWIVLLLAATCTFLSLAVPAITADSDSPSR